MLAQYAPQLQAKKKGVVFIGNTFVIGLLGVKDMIDIAPIEKITREVSKKEVKVQKMDQVKFNTKEKGKKPIATKDILQFALTGQDLDVNTKIAEVLKEAGCIEV